MKPWHSLVLLGVVACSSGPAVDPDHAQSDLVTVRSCQDMASINSRNAGSLADLEAAVADVPETHPARAELVTYLAEYRDVHRRQELAYDRMCDWQAQVAPSGWTRIDSGIATHVNRVGAERR